MPEKTIDGWLVVDWKTGSHRTRQSKPSASELGTNELLARLAIDVTVPEVDVPTLALEIDVPEPQVHAATLEALSEDELPDWTDAVIAAVSEREDETQSADLARQAVLVDSITVDVLTDVPTRPDPEQVRSFTRELVEAVASGDGLEAVLERDSE